MRLIDADALLEKKQERDCCFTVTEWDILNAPTVVPVKHGKWIIDRDCTHCSECRDVFGCTIMGYFTPKHCPSCGARMDGAIDED